jgi:APA family basic amino acid/polyamine antiporter
MARDGLFFRGCAGIHPRLQTPAVALIVQGIWSAVLALSGSYSRLLTYVTFASLSFNALTVVGLFVLRRRTPPKSESYRTWGYPLTPALYLLGAAFFILYILIGDPVASLIGIGLVAVGFPAYAIFRRRARADLQRS